MRISDWSSDVCSSDLLHGDVSEGLLQLRAIFRKIHVQRTGCAVLHKLRGVPGGSIREAHSVDDHPLRLHVGAESLRLRERAAVRSVLIDRSEEHTSELQSLMRISYAVFCLKKKTIHNQILKPIK